MVTVVIIICLLIWFPVLLNQIARRGLWVLLIWLFMAPVASNVINSPGTNPFFQGAVVENNDSTQQQPTVIFQGNPTLYRHGETVALRDLLEPTRMLFGAFFIVFVVGAVLKRQHERTFDRTEILMCGFALILLTSVFLRSKGLAFGLRITTDAFIVPFLGYFFARRLVTNEALSRISKPR